GRFTASTKQSVSADVSSKSIAVLPFDNLSSDKENAYFASGIQDEIITRLAKIADLKVISRTSTQQYQSKPGNLSEIAKQLGVANILEGSVQKAADQVRVNVQLIQVASDSHLCADTYDRKLVDIFGVESEVARKPARTGLLSILGAAGLRTCQSDVRPRPGAFAGQQRCPWCSRPNRTTTRTLG